MEVMTAEQAAEAGKDLDFAKVWAALMRTDEQIAALSISRQRTEALIAELSISGQRTDEQIAKTSKEVAALSISRQRTEALIAELSISGQRTDEQIAKTSKEVAKLSISGQRTDEQIAKLSISGQRTEALIAELSKNIGGVNKSLGRWTEEMVAAKLWEKFEAFDYEFTKGSRNIKFREGGQVIAEADIFLENGDYAMLVEVKTDLINEDIDDHLDRIGKIRLYMDKRGDKRHLVGAVAGAIVPENVCHYAQKKGLYVLVQSGDSVEVAGMPKGFEVRKW